MAAGWLVPGIIRFAKLGIGGWKAVLMMMMMMMLRIFVRRNKKRKRKEKKSPRPVI